jgi:hypothetical protein
MKFRRIEKSLESIDEFEIENSRELKSFKRSSSTAGERKSDSEIVLSNWHPFTLKLKDSLPMTVISRLSPFWKNEERHCNCVSTLSALLVCCSVITSEQRPDM